MRLFFLWNILLCILSAEFPTPKGLEISRLNGPVSKVCLKFDVELKEGQSLIVRVYCPVNEESVLMLDEVTLVGSNEIIFATSPGWRLHANRPVFLSLFDQFGTHLGNTPDLVFANLPLSPLGKD
jgi:hypothetical protein